MGTDLLLVNRRDKHWLTINKSVPVFCPDVTCTTAWTQEVEQRRSSCRGCTNAVEYVDDLSVVKKC